MNGAVHFLAVLAACMAVRSAGAQNPTLGAELRMDEAVSERLTDPADGAVYEEEEVQPPTAYLVNGKVFTRDEADDLLTLWNVEDVQVLYCRQKLPGGGRIAVRYLIFKMQKRYRPHLAGNIAGYSWSARALVKTRSGGKRVGPRAYIGHYILHTDYDSVRTVRGGGPLRSSDVVARKLSPEAYYLLDGKPVPSDALRYLDGLIVKSLDYLPPREAVARYGECASQGAVVATLFEGRMPLILFDDVPVSFETWLKHCSGKYLNMGSPLNYRFLSPLTAVERYGRKGIYGCIYIRSY